MRILPVLLLAAPAALAQEATSLDARIAYHHFEAAWLAASAHRAEAEKIFDAQQKKFLDGRYLEVVQTLDRLTEQLSGRKPPAFRVRVEPWVSARGTTATLTVSRLYDDGIQTCSLRVLRDDGTAMVMQEAGDGTTIRLEAEKRGRYLVALGEWTVARWYVTDEPVDVVRRRNAKRLAKLRGPDAAACRSRNELLQSRFAERLTEARIAPPNLVRKLDKEIAAIEKGGHPYRGRHDIYWRTAGLARVRCFVYAPKGVKKPAIVIALHDTGAHEGSFIYSQGGGQFITAARTRGFVLISANTLDVMGNLGAFNALVAMAERDHGADGKRVFLVGHGLGGIVASDLSVPIGRRLTALACVSQVGRLSPTVPTLIVAGTRDPAADPERLEKEAAGRPNVEFRKKLGWGQTLLLHEFLKEIIDWLLDEKRMGS